MNQQFVKFIALLSTGLLAGTFFYATVNIVPTFWEVPASVQLVFRTALMRHNALTMQLEMGVAIITSGWFCWTVRHFLVSRLFALVAVAMGVATLLITRLGSVPINLAIKTWNPAAPPTDWLETMVQWDTFHLCRTISAIGSFVFLLLADSLKQTSPMPKRSDTSVPLSKLRPTLKAN